MKSWEMMSIFNQDFKEFYQHILILPKIVIMQKTLFLKMQIFEIATNKISDNLNW